MINPLLLLLITLYLTVGYFSRSSPSALQFLAIESVTKLRFVLLLELCDYTVNKHSVLCPSSVYDLIDYFHYTQRASVWRHCRERDQHPPSQDRRACAGRFLP
jgi:hypothetical protein